MNRDVGALEELAALYGVQPSYRDERRHLRRARPESLLAVLISLGAPLTEPGGAADAAREVRRRAWSRLIEPVHLAWGGGSVRAQVRVPASARGEIVCHLRVATPDGEEVRLFRRPLDEVPTLARAPEGEDDHALKRLDVPGPLPYGYHALEIEAGGARGESLVISAPAAAPARGRGRWGVFLPLYALRSRRSWGTGDFSDLSALAAWIGREGGSAVGTLPLLAEFLDEPCDWSPYAPASRLFWNEIFVDVEKIPEFRHCREARRLLESPDFAARVRELREAGLVDYRGQAGLKRRILGLLARAVSGADGGRGAEFRRFLAARPEVSDYARFRAAGERLGAPWPRWPRKLREGSIGAEDYDPEAERTHAYAQWVAEEQIGAMARGAASAGVDLYFDLPVGVHPSGYDVYRERDLFVERASAGAPPDGFFARGQDWGFPPLHPQRLRERQYRHFIAVLRHHLRHARLLRIDHVMWLHRLFFIPAGTDPEDGVYVAYPHEELYAILCLEASRAGAVIVGEDLGTVPGQVRREMARRGLRRMYVMQWEAKPRPAAALPDPPRESLAALGTHDMPTFAGFWEGRDIEDRLGLGLLDEDGAAAERARRSALRDALERFLRERGRLSGEATPASALRACLRHLAAGPAQFVLVNLEDLWLESEPQNVPGTGGRRPNWRRKARLPLERLQEEPAVVEALRELCRLRNERREDT